MICCTAYSRLHKRENKFSPTTKLSASLTAITYITHNIHQKCQTQDVYLMQRRPSAACSLHPLSIHPHNSSAVLTFHLSNAAPSSKQPQMQSPSNDFHGMMISQLHFSVSRMQSRDSNLRVPRPRFSRGLIGKHTCYK